jgi:formate hydrogenlyase subunit 3/multisubunit Na+/H+ antiporter MnhD subunit
MTALVWTAAGVSARAELAADARRTRYFGFHLLTLAGNVTLLVAADAVAFYLGFALMTFAAYGLVVHDGTPAARRAGRVYLVMAVLGEGALLAGLLLAGSASGGALALPDLAAAVADAPRRGAIVALLLVGFGVKAGALPLHVWLPLAHPVAPTPASAVLSGCMIKAGLLGWLRFLPVGEVALAGWGALLVAAGLAAAFFGALAGIAQDDAKTTLAYSSVSQMGLLTVAVGIGLAAPSAAPAALAACAFLAVHHGLAKGALFLGAGVVKRAGTLRSRRIALLSLLLPGLALAGAPLTSGAIAKSRLSHLGDFAPSMPLGLSTWLLAAATGTTLLLARFFVLVARATETDRTRRPAAGLWLPHAALLLGLAALGLWGPAWSGTLAPAERALSLATIVKGVGPILAGLLLAWLGARARPSTRLPAGDLLLLVERPLGRAFSRVARLRLRPTPEAVAFLASRWYGLHATSRPTDRLLRAEIALTRWETAALLLALLVAGLFTLIWAGSR